MTAVVFILIPSSELINFIRDSLMARMVKNPPAMQETLVQSREDPLEKGRATHSSFLAWRLPWTEEPGELYSLWGRQESGSQSRIQVSD